MQMYINIILVTFFALCSITILISAIIYTLRSTVFHLQQTAGTTTWKELIQHTAKIDKITVVLEIIDLCLNLTFALYIILSNNGVYTLVVIGYICLVITSIGFILLLIKLKLATKLYNIFTEWKTQKNELIKANENVKRPTDDDIREMHQILLDIKVHEVDVAMFDLFGIGMENIPIICCILLITMYNQWIFEIFPLIIMLSTVLLISWKIMKLIVIKCGCNDPSDVPSKFATLNTYRPSWTNKNYNPDETEDDMTFTSKGTNMTQTTMMTGMTGQTNTHFSPQINPTNNNNDKRSMDYDDEKDTECTSLNMYFGSDAETMDLSPVVASIDDNNNNKNEEKVIEKIWIDPVDKLPEDVPSLIKQDSRLGNKKAKEFRDRANTAHV